MKQFLIITLGITLLVCANPYEGEGNSNIHLATSVSGQCVGDSVYRIKQLKNRLVRNTDTVMVIAHRGDWRNAPENSLPAIQNCIDMGVDMVQTILRTTGSRRWKRQ